MSNDRSRSPAKCATTSESWPDAFTNEPSDLTYATSALEDGHSCGYPWALSGQHTRSRSLPVYVVHDVAHRS